MRRTVTKCEIAPPGRKAGKDLMAQNVSVIGIDPNELHWIRMLILLLRHPDPSIPELARQALIYLSDSAANRALRSRRESDLPGETAQGMPG
jgi:hypothetical protein